LASRVWPLPVPWDSMENPNKGELKDIFKHAIDYAELDSMENPNKGELKVNLFGLGLGLGSGLGADSMENPNKGELKVATRGSKYASFRDSMENPNKGELKAEAMLPFEMDQKVKIQWKIPIKGN
jgi:hypothetical protein